MHNPYLCYLKVLPQQGRLGVAEGGGGQEGGGG